MHIHFVTVGKNLEPIKLGFRMIPGIDKAYILMSSAYPEEQKELEEYLDDAGIAHESVIIDEYNFSDVADKISAIHNKEKESGVRHKYTMNVTGSTKVASFAAYSSAYFVGATVYYVRELSEAEKKKNVPVEDQLLTLVTTRAPKKSKTDKKAKQIMDFILERTTGGTPVTSSDICDRFGFSKQQVAYYIKNLREEGLIEITNGVQKDGKINYSYNSLRLSQQGMMVAKYT